MTKLRPIKVTLSPLFLSFVMSKCLTPAAILQQAENLMRYVFLLESVNQIFHFDFSLK